MSDPHPVVLLVEDEPLVRMFNADVLDDANYRVIEAANGEEALTLFEARPDIRRGYVAEPRGFACRHSSLDRNHR